MKVAVPSQIITPPPYTQHARAVSSYPRGRWTDLGGSHRGGSVPVDVAVGESDCGTVNEDSPTLYNTHGPSVAIHRGDGQILGGSHVVGSVLVDVAAGERDFGASFDENTSTLPAERGSVNRLTYLSMGAMDRLGS